MCYCLLEDISKFRIIYQNKKEDGFLTEHGLLMLVSLDLVYYLSKHTIESSVWRVCWQDNEWKRKIHCNEEEFWCSSLDWVCRCIY